MLFLCPVYNIKAKGEYEKLNIVYRWQQFILTVNQFLKAVSQLMGHEEEIITIDVYGDTGITESYKKIKKYRTKVRLWSVLFFTYML